MQVFFKKYFAARANDPARKGLRQIEEIKVIEINRGLWGTRDTKAYLL
jgi:hypothetical protein